jgi:hypothetical protein
MTDLIKLTQKGARAYNSTGGALYRAKMDWGKRTGKIVKYNRGRSLAYVVWDGNRTFDRVPVNLLESADPS